MLPAENLEYEEQTSCARRIGVWSQLDGFSLRSRKSLRDEGNHILGLINNCAH